MDPVPVAASRPLAEVLESVRRLGPRPYSVLGPGPRREPLPEADLVEWVVETIDRRWVESGRPDPYTVVEAGAGEGARASRVLEQGPQCLSALRYVLVEPDPVARERHAGFVPLETPALVLGPTAPRDPDDPDEDPPPATGRGPLVTSLGSLPVLSDLGPVTAIAIGCVGALASDRVEWRESKWWEVRIGADDTGLVEILVPLADEPGVVTPETRPDGARYPILSGAVEWLASALRMADSGTLAVVDRWTRLTDPMAKGGDPPPLALDQLASVRRPVAATPAELFPGLSVVTWRLG